MSKQSVKDGGTKPIGRPRLARPLKPKRPNGRPRSVLPSALVDRIGPPPKDPMAKSAWWEQLIEELTWGVMQGEPWSTLLDTARTSAGAAAKLIPEAIRFRAQELLQEDKEDRDAQDAPDDEPIEEMKPHADANRAAPLRRNPSRS